MILTNSKVTRKEENFIELYYNKISNNEIIACNKIKEVYNHIMQMITQPPPHIHYDNKKALRVIDFIEKYCHPSKGKHARQPLKLQLWQKALISSVYGFVDDDGKRIVKECLLMIGRKNGKSTLASALSLYHLTKDDEQGAEVVSFATKKEQAKIVWSESKKMVSKSPALRQRLKTTISSIRYDTTNSDFKPLASDSNTLDGLNVSFAVGDEIHAYSLQKGGMYDIVKDSMSAREQPLLLLCTTAGFVREGLFDSKYKEAERILKGYRDNTYIDFSFLPFVYELDNKEELFDESLWIKANPAIDILKNRKDLQQKLYKAKADNSLLKNLLTKDFDLPQSGKEAFFNMQHLNTSTHDIKQHKPDYFICGVDLSRTTDLTAAVILYKLPDDDTIYIDCMAWMPADTLKEHERDNVPYSRWIEDGWLRLCNGNVINDNDVVDWLIEQRTEYDSYLYKCGYDRYSATHFIQEMYKNFGEKSMLPIAQGTKTLSTPMETSKLYFKKKKINYNNNPLFAWCMLNTEAKADSNGNIQPFKNRELNIRIDAYAAFLNAFTVYLDNIEEYSILIDR